MIMIVQELFALSRPSPSYKFISSLGREGDHAPGRS